MLNKRNIVYICKCCLGVIFALILMYIIKECVFGLYIPEALAARALPLSITLVAISILFFSIGYENRK
ncbi:hypothetical protein [Finegoldia magna]|uniref:hypothetical protein n=1 Tax=Finegoldia magna TaxID=1260 RepID=UPI001ED32ADD|nr:hypothetical protein [Finegoldia magna]MBS5360364.1 hypothetical protein [Finegoldia magna]MDU5508580.1 hypothetical protein [Finegoldia magna]MDU6880571.1 hypothetical protein [Finegoldia magna]